jgi:hypothetical protein
MSSAATSPSPSTTSVASVSSPSNPLEAEWDRLGRAFCVLYEIWPDRQHLNKPYPENVRQSGGPWHPGRYRSKDTRREAIIAELYHFVPERFHIFLKTSPVFANAVCIPAASLSFPLTFRSSRVARRPCEVILSATFAAPPARSFPLPQLQSTGEISTRGVMNAPPYRRS